MPIPVKGSYPAYYEKYIEQIIETDVMDAINAQQDNIEKFCNPLVKRNQCSLMQQVNGH